jgi:PAS domain S-box-containing protein
VPRMQDKNKTKEQLTKELTGLRQRIAKLERAENKRKKEVLRGSERELREVIDSVKDGIVLLDLTGTVTAINKSVTEAVGYAEEDVVGKRFKLLKMFPPKSIAAMLTAFTRVISGQQPPPYEVEVYTRTGEKLFVEIHGSILRKGGAKAGVITALRDITERKQMEALLLRERDTFVTILQHALYGVVLLDRDGNYVFVNSAFTAITGYTLEDIPTTRDWLHKAYPDEAYRQQVTEFWEKDRRVGVMRREVSVVCKNGETKKIEFGSTVLGDGRAVVMLADITERKRAEEALERHHEDLEKLVTERTASLQAANEQLQREITERKRVEKKLQRAYGELKESEERFRTIFETAQDFIALKDRDCKFTYVNPAMERVFGISASKLIGKTSVALFGKGKSARIIEEDLRVLSGEIINEEHPSPVKGSSAIHNIIKVPIRNSAGEIIGLCNIGRDITERKQMEEALRESEEKYRSLVESSEDSIYLVDSKCNYIFLNNRHLARLGVQSSEIIGKGYSEFHNPEESKGFAQRIKTVLKTGQSLSYEYRSQRDNRYFIRTLSPVKTPDGGVIKAITVTSKDITERKRAEEMLRESEAKYRNLFEHTKDAVFVADAQTGIIIDANMAACNMLDMPREKIIGMHQSQLHPPAEVERYQQIFRNHVENKVAITEELFVQRPDSKRIPVDISASVMELAGKSIIQGSFRDITERKQAEELLQKERDNFYSILERAPYGVMVLEADGKFSFVNAEFTNISGYTLEDIRPASKWMHRAYPDQHYRNMVKETWKNDYTQSKDEETFRKRFGRTFSRAFTVICKDGAAKDIEFRTAFIGDEGTMFMLSDITERQRMLALLETAAAEWRTTFDAINDAVCLLDPYGKIIRCNNAMLRLLGKSFSQIMNHHCWEVIHGVSEAPQSCPIARVGKTHQRESEVMFKDARWINISVDPLLDEDGDLIGSVHIMSDITDRMRIQNELQDSREQLRNLTVHLESVREQERTNIAREIHDELAQTLTALKMDLSWLDHRLPRDPQSLSEKTKSMNNLIDSTLQTVKRISAELRPGILDDLGLVAAIEWQAEEFQNRTGISCNVTVDPQDLTVDQDLSTAIFRIFQETLTNVARHAHATNVAVGLKERAERLTLRVRDNGTGIKEEQIFDPKSFGLIGIRERVYPWGGKFSIKGIPGKGTTVVVNVRLGQSKKDIEKN